MSRSGCLAVKSKRLFVLPTKKITNIFRFKFLFKIFSWLSLGKEQTKPLTCLPTYPPKLGTRLEKGYATFGWNPE